jgi:hypothetical protein
MRRYMLGVAVWNYHGNVGNLRRISAISSDDPENVEAALRGLLKSADKIDAYIALSIAATHRKYQNGILVIGPTALQPFGKNGLPSLIIYARGELRDVVGRRISFDIAKLAEVIHRMAGIASTTAHSEDEKPASAIPHCGDAGGHLVDNISIEAPTNVGCLLQKYFCMAFAQTLSF